MTATIIAVLGGDEREHHIATTLARAGRDVRTFAGARADPHSEYTRARTARHAVDGAQWIICPYPGLGPGDEIYAPGYDVPLRLDRSLLAGSEARSGGLILGRSSPTVQTVCEDLGITVHETKSDSGLAVQTASAVSEALLPLLVESTDRLLREHLYVVLGFGSTGFAITQMLVALRCDVMVAARSKRDRERARQLGAHPVDYAERVAFMESADIVINTVPHVDAVPLEAGATRTTARILDIASPPGGMDHQALLGVGLDVRWLRGLAGLRAPASMAEAQLTFIEGLLDRGQSQPATDPHRHEARASSGERGQP